MKFSDGNNLPKAKPEVSGIDLASALRSGELSTASKADLNVIGDIGLIPGAAGLDYELE